MSPDVTQKQEHDTHEKHPLRIALDGNEYELLYHESEQPTARTVISLPGLPDDSITVVEGVKDSQLKIPVNYISLKFQYPFSLEIYERILMEAIRTTGSKKVIITASCLGGAVLGRVLNQYATGINNDNFDLMATVFITPTVDRNSFNGRWCDVLYRLPEKFDVRQRLIRLMVPVAAEIYPDAVLSDRARAGAIDYRLVDQELSSVPETYVFVRPPGVQVSYIGLDADRVINNAYNYTNLGIPDDHFFMLQSSKPGSGHHPKNEAEMYALVARLIMEGFSGT
jgi:hypothetical protein